MERQYKLFSGKDAEGMKRAGEIFESRGFVKTEGFEKAVVFAMSLAEEIYNISSKHKRFRMELFYDAESLNVNYCFFCPGPDERDAGLKESIYKKLENLGASRENIYEFERLLVQSGLEMDFGEFAGKMAGYAVEIYYLSEITRDAPERLWSIWKETVREYLVEYDDSEEMISSLEQEWKMFRRIATERSW